MMIQPGYRIEVGEFKRLTLALVGCGGTGSFAALHLARLAWVMQSKGVKVDLVFIDPDTVEAKNIGRQNFCPAEVGQSKARALAWRYGAAFGLRIWPVETRFIEWYSGAFMANSKSRVTLDLARVGMYDGLCVVVGCVDTPAARREIRKMTWGPKCWWLDSGNDLSNGQVLIGNWHQDVASIDPGGFATMVPLPSVQEPGLLNEQLAMSNEQAASCAELLLAETQSLMINQMMASWIGVYLARLVMSRDLDVMATYVNLRGAVRSVPVTGDMVEIEKAAGTGIREFLDVAGGAWTAEELAEITDGTCPECGGDVAQGRDTYDEQEVAIVFCPQCVWQMTVEELEMALLHEEAVYGV